jgi:hypothetical protein
MLPGDRRLSLEIESAPVALVGMSSPSATADASLSAPGGRGAERSLRRDRAAALTSANNPDLGQPVADLPPLIEPTIELVGHRPPRRSFLAPAIPLPATTLSPELVSFEIPEIVEPVAAPPVHPVPPPATKPATARLAGLLAAVRAVLPTRRKWWLTAIAGASVVFALMVAIADVAHLGPFSQVRHYPIAAAPTNLAARVAYYQQGAQEGDADAELRLAILYAKGEGVAQDYATAANWFRAAATQGLPRAQYDLGVLYERGRGMPVDLTEAANWYLKAAQGNYPLAQYNLAVCYTKGQGIRQDLAEAALWYRRAALQGVVQAMTNLGMMYEKGEGITISPVDAYAWYLAAGRRNNEAAARRATELFASLPHLDQIRAEALAGDVSGSIRDPEPERGEAAAGNP